jgi:hypothetical protein
LTEDLNGWQAVAVALINMIGAVVMSFLRERTNQTRIRKNGSE